jgi:hypothetical protein
MIMKKLICIFIMSWLPCFMMAANAMGMQMVLENALQHATQTADHAQMSCHEQVNHDKTSENKTNHPDSHHCSFCAFCVVGSAVASTHLLKMSHLKTDNIQHTSLDVAFSSQDYPPAIKPPILN